MHNRLLVFYLHFVCKHRIVMNLVKRLSSTDLVDGCYAVQFFFFEISLPSYPFLDINFNMK
jgi:hypothetical protein